MHRFLALLVIQPILAGCSPRDPAASNEPLSVNVVAINARGMTFEAPSEVPAGWTTFRFSNLSSMAYFDLIQRLPVGVNTADQQAQVAPVFQAGMNRLAAGEADAAMAEFGKLPAWFGDVVFTGGPGFVSAGGTAAVTVYLEPGLHMLECYVKTAGVFHSYNPAPGSWGMVHQFTVTDSGSETTAPEATAEISISAETGFAGDLQLVAGENVVAVRFLDQGPHENFVGHDLHLARLADDTDLAAVEAWMDWRSPSGLNTPALVEFIGGTNEMPAGTVAYMHLTLEPGRYAWIAEVPNAGEKGMLVEFKVPGDA
jgi:hypothetical protein